MPDTVLPDLTFPSVQLGARETPWDLRPLLYRGGAASNAGKVSGLIEAGTLGAPVLERIELVRALHSAIVDKLAAGGSRASQVGVIEALRAFFAWADESGVHMDLSRVAKTYVEWSDHLLRRARMDKGYSMRTAYGTALRVSNVLDRVLDRATPLVQVTRLSKGTARKVALSTRADKQNLSWTFAFGHLLQDLCDALTTETVWGPLPVRVVLRNGKELVDWSGMKKPKARPANWEDDPKKRYAVRASEASRQAYTDDKTLKTRYPLTNLRVEAELLMFVGQTGMNLSQAHALKLKDFFYSSDIDGYKVRDRKERRQGEVLFEVFKEYRPHFERYLAWRREFFPRDERLFPFVTASRADHEPTQLSRTRKTCERLGVKFVPPSALRSARVNWLLRRSGDADLTAEMAQHSKETLLRVYERPSLQRAVSETLRFWAKNDPALSRTTPVAPGECTGVPKAVPGIPVGAQEPDCVRASGCLWCEHHRDVDSLDHVWALATFRHLKVIETSRYRLPPGDEKARPADHAVARLSDKLRWFRESNDTRRSWVEEALARVEEGNYHPDWEQTVVSAEGALQ